MTEVFTWTMSGQDPPIYVTDDDYSVQVVSSITAQAGTYTVTVQDYVEYTHPVAGDQVWENIFQTFSVYVENPCLDTLLYIDDTSFENITYHVEDPRQNHRFTGVSDTISNAFAGANCGLFQYTLATNDTEVGSYMLSVVDLIGGKAVSIQTDNVDTIGNYTITVTVTLVEYPE